MLETLLCDLREFVMNLRNSWTSLKRTKEAKNTFISNNHKQEESKQKVSGLCLQGGRLPEEAAAVMVELDSGCLNVKRLCSCCSALRAQRSRQQI